MKNYYQILGVAQTSSPEAIRLAYRSKAKACHPDLYQGKDSKEKFQLINEAYQILKDDKKRRLYDYRLNYIIQRQRVSNNRGRYPYSNVQYYRRPHYTPQARKSNNEDEYQWFEKIFDNVLFVFMVLVGAYAVGFGFYRLFYAPVDGVNPLAGIIAGTIFTVVIIYGWSLRVKK